LRGSRDRGGKGSGGGGGGVVVDLRVVRSEKRRGPGVSGGARRRGEGVNPNKPIHEESEDRLTKIVRSKAGAKGRINEATGSRSHA